MFSEHFYPCDRNEDRKSVQWMFLALRQKLETQERSGNVFSPTPRNWRELERSGDIFLPY